VPLPFNPRLRLVAIVLASAGLAAGALLWFQWLRVERLPLHTYDLQDGAMAEWKAYGGSWEIANGVLRNNSDERGAKLLAGSTQWSNYTLTADVQFDGEHGDLGVILRSNAEEEGVDAYNGYYVGLRTTDGTLVIGRSDYGWMEARPVKMPGGVHASTWYRLKVTAFGCNIAASSEDLSTQRMAWVAFEEDPCVESGRIGLRSLATGGMWRNIAVSPASRSDYDELGHNAVSVEHPEFPKREADYNSFFHFAPASSSVTQPRDSNAKGPGRDIHIGDLQNFPRNEGENAVLRGVVILTSPGLYVQDSTGGILVKDSQIPQLNVGDAVEVEGHADPGLYSAVVRGGTVRLLWSGTPIPPTAITPSQAASGAYDSRFVEIEGRLTGMELTPHGDQVFDFTQGGQSFRAVYANRPADFLHRLEINSSLRIRGVCVLDRRYTQERAPFVVLLSSVDDIQVLAGPPWWTPLHIGMIFVAAIAFALLIQLVYFRIQQWKAYAISQERNRLAHEIHDTMAQSFAGVGYQIQGIRSGVLRGDRQDLGIIADQLSVAYQLVRRCHEEASRTISMLGSSSPEIQHNLLGTLAETARKIAGNQIRTQTTLYGNPFPLNLRLANALLQIGQEAIANAVSHGNPTALNITLRYEDSGVELVVEDDGKGFDYQPQEAGFGILGMQKRAREVAGTLSINTTVGHGTQVRVHANQQPVSLLKRMFGMGKEKVPTG